jgi:hypothetical protein
MHYFCTPLSGMIACILHHFKHMIAGGIGHRWFLGYFVLSFANYGQHCFAASQVCDEASARQPSRRHTVPAACSPVCTSLMYAKPMVPLPLVSTGLVALQPPWLYWHFFLHASISEFLHTSTGLSKYHHLVRPLLFFCIYINKRG